MQAIVLPCRDLSACGHLSAPPRALVVDVSLPGVLDAIASWKARWPEVPAIGIVRLPDPDLWSEAESRGADLVVTHGAVHRRLQSFLSNFSDRPGTRKVRVGEMKDFDGRLGFVAGLDDEEADEIALYHIGYEIYAVSDICPHAGGRLSEGELSGAVLTCPRHGSQFDVTDGERLRGPADERLMRYRVTVEGGIVYVEIPSRR